jgi:DNA-binding NarL/FixJ family response regulator
MFEPFAKKAHPGSYAGLALKICSDVVTSHHGHIEVVNLPAGGSEFRVLLPRAAEVERSAPTRRMAAVSVTPAEGLRLRRVFVVDDDELFCRTMRRALKPHDVRTAASASEAEIALLDPSYSPDLIVCDLGLPGFHGDVLHTRVKAKRAELGDRFVFVTGGACGKKEADYVRASGCPTLLKPVDTKELLDALSKPVLTASVVPNEIATLQSSPPRPSSPEAPTEPPEGGPDLPSPAFSNPFGNGSKSH